MEKGARESGRTVWEVAKFYEDYSWKSFAKVNIERPDIVARATEHIGEQIKLIQLLEKNGFTYQTDQAIYFDVTKFPDYTKLSGQKLSDKEVGVRQDVYVDKQKRHPADFVLWFFTVGHFSDHIMRWDAPWGEGFPGWHIECSAMSMGYLGNTIDIHTGGIDHISVHHTNEIAQSEAASKQKFVNFWVHHGWLLVDGEKMSKSKKNYYRIEDVLDKGFDPLALRYLFLTTHYKDSINFTWESLTASQNALNNLKQKIVEWPLDETIKPDESYQKFLEALNHDLNTPQALAILWQMVKDDKISASQKVTNLLKMDEVLGLDLKSFINQTLVIPESVQKLIDQREKARIEKNFELSDKLRHEIKKQGFEILDTSDGQKVKQVK